jgi:hypothetical protein
VASAQKLLCADWNVVYFDRSLNLVQHALDTIALPPPPPKAIVGSDADGAGSIVSPTAAVADGEGATLSDTARSAVLEMWAAVTNAAAAVSSIAVGSQSHAAADEGAHTAAAAEAAEGSIAIGSAPHVQVSVSDADDDEADGQQLVGRVLDGSIDIVDAFERQSEDLRDPQVWPYQRLSWYSLVLATSFRRFATSFCSLNSVPLQLINTNPSPRTGGLHQTGHHSPRR